MITYTVKVSDDGSQEWYFNDKLHREDGPAFDNGNGTKVWWFHGQRHREDGPAIEWNDGTKEWYLKGLRHREDGPAMEYPNGKKEWWLNSIQYTKQDFDAEMKRRKSPSCNGKIVEIDGKKYKLQLCD